ncbi:MAG: hypothetical protein Q4D51_09815 [Eubacteriales bacterium]|nr:hypothetical protein [Eubacteriales bacterium]
MKATKMKMKKSFFLVAVLMICVLWTSNVSHAKWVKHNGKYMYSKNESGTLFYKNQWVKIDGIYYYFDKNGYRKQGWLKYRGKKYYLNSKGIRVTGFKTIKKKKYYFTKKGVMITGWLKYNHHYYYLNQSGVMVTGLRKIGDYIYYFDQSGKRVADADIYFGNMSYYFSENGALEYTGTEEEMAVAYINIKRMLKGYKPLEYVEKSNLTYAATQRAYELEKKKSHIRPDGTKYSTVLRTEYPVENYWSGECIFWGTEKRGTQVAADWLANSNSKVLLEEKANAIGIAKHMDYQGCEYWTAIVIQK